MPSAEACELCDAIVEDHHAKVDNAQRQGRVQVRLLIQKLILCIEKLENCRFWLVSADLLGPLCYPKWELCKQHSIDMYENNFKCTTCSNINDIQLSSGKVGWWWWTPMLFITNWWGRPRLHQFPSVLEHKNVTPSKKNKNPLGRSSKGPKIR